MSIKNLKLRENEKVIETISHHPIVVIPHIVISFLILVLDFFLMYFLFLQGWWGVALFTSVIILVAFYVLRLVFLYRKNCFVLTNQRLIDFEQSGFFEKFVNEFPYSKIKQAKSVVKGIAPTIFKYGNLKLVLGGDVGSFELYKIADPGHWQDLINKQLSGDNITSSFIENDSRGIDRLMSEVELLSREEKWQLVKKIKRGLRDQGV